MIRSAVLALLLAAGAAAQPAQSSPDGRDADRAAIRAHIESIFQAFIDGDVEKIHATHADDWRGFLEGSRTPIKGIDEYMRANGIAWPRPAAAPAATPAAAPAPSPAAKPGYAVKEFDAHFYGPDLAVASFFGEFNRVVNGATVTTNRLRIMDVYGRRNGHWIQVASHTVTDPLFQLERTATPAPKAAMPPQVRQQILDARENVWRAYFSNDQKALETLIGDELVAIDDAPGSWSDKAAILAGAGALSARGAKLLRLTFPKTELQVYGPIIVVYTTYAYDLDVNGTVTTASGRGTEIFVRRGGTFVNVGWHLDGGR